MANETDPFVEFKSWLKNGEAGEWPVLGDGKNLSNQQTKIVNRNVSILLNYSDWQEKIERFENAIMSLPCKETRSTERAKYEIRFDRVDLGNSFLDFSDRIFPCSVIFSATQFPGAGASFKGAKFLMGPISFASIRLNSSGNLNFCGAEFGEGGVYFNNASITSNNVQFNNCIFRSDTISFKSVKFSSHTLKLSFEEAEFGDAEIFFENIFIENGSKCSFLNSKFGSGNVSFENTNFGGSEVVFNDANFGRGNVSFKSTKFSIGDVSLYGASFDGGEVNFSKSIFENCNLILKYLSLNNVDFIAPDVSISGSLYMTAGFPGKVKFRRLKVTETADFSGCSFNKIPDFRDAKFDRAPEVSGMTVPPPVLIKQKWWKPSLASNPNDASKYRKLKAMALDSNDHEKDGEFFSYEMLAKRGVELHSKADLALNSFYSLTSNFGQSYTRPLIWIFVSFIAFSLAYFAIIAEASFGKFDVLFAIELSLRNSMPFIGSLFRFSYRPDGHEGWFSDKYHNLLHDGISIDLLVWTGVVQQFIGVIFLFLFILGLRNKFRLK